MCEHGELLYVGVAYDLQRRIAQHRATKSWWPEVDRVLGIRYATRAEALVLENRMIKQERPCYNVAGKPAAADLVSSFEYEWVFCDNRGGVVDQRGGA